MHHNFLWKGRTYKKQEKVEIRVLNQITKSQKRKLNKTNFNLSIYHTDSSFFINKFQIKIIDMGNACSQCIETNDFKMSHDNLEV